MAATGRKRELSNDQMAAIAVVVVAVGVLWGKRRLIATAVGNWLQQHQITLTPGQGLVTIPILGSLDLPRLLAAVAATGLIALAAAVWLRPWLDQNRADRRRGDRRPAAADELD